MVRITSIEKQENGNEIVYGKNGHGEFKIEKINSYILGGGAGIDSMKIADIEDAIDKFKPVERIIVPKKIDPFRDELIKIIAVEVFRDAPEFFTGDRAMNIVDSMMEARKK